MSPSKKKQKGKKPRLVKQEPKKPRLVKLAIKEVKEVAPEHHVIAAELHVQGAKVLPSMVPVEEIIVPKFLARAAPKASPKWYEWLKNL
jgi:hypothetical protein